MIDAINNPSPIFPDFPPRGAGVGLGLGAASFKNVLNVFIPNIYKTPLRGFVFLGCNHFHKPVDHIPAHYLLLLILDEGILDLAGSQVAGIDIIELVKADGILGLHHEERIVGMVSGRNLDIRLLGPLRLGVLVGIGIRVNTFHIKRIVNITGRVRQLNAHDMTTSTILDPLNETLSHSLMHVQTIPFLTRIASLGLRIDQRGGTGNDISGSLTIGKDNHMIDITIELSDKVLVDLRNTKQALIERSGIHLHPRRISIREIQDRHSLRIPLKGKSIGKDVIEHLGFLCLGVAGREQMEKREHRRTHAGEMFAALRIVPHVSHELATVSIRSLVKIIVTRHERIDLVRNITTTAEVHKDNHLTQGVRKNISHGARPVNKHDETVVLALLDVRAMKEQIISHLVGMETIHIQNTGGATRSTLVNISRLLHLELLAEQIDRRLRLRAEISQYSLSLCEFDGVILLRIVIALRKIVKLNIHVDTTQNILGRNNSQVQLGLRNNHGLVRFLVLALLDKALLNILLHALLSHRSVHGFSLDGLGRNSVRRDRTSTLDSLSAGLLTRGRLRTLLTGTFSAIAARRGVLTIAIRITNLLLVGVRVHLKFHFLHELKLGVTIEILGDLNDLFPSFSSLDAIDELLLIDTELTKIDKRTNLEVKVKSVDELKILGVLALKTEHIGLKKFLITKPEVTLGTGILLLNQTLDASILNDVEIQLPDHRVLRTDLLGLVLPVLVRTAGSVDSMTNLMGDQHVIQMMGHLLPHGKDKGARSEIKRRSASGVRMHDIEIFGGQKTSEDALRIVSNFVVAHDSIVP